MQFVVLIHKLIISLKIKVKHDLQTEPAITFAAANIQIVIILLLLKVSDKIEGED